VDWKLRCVGLEIIEGLVILGVFMSAIVGGLYYKKTTSPVKKAQKRNEISLFDHLTEYREVEKGTISDILKQKDNQIKSLNARLKQLEPVEEAEPQEVSGKSITWEEVQTLVHEAAPKYAMALPMFKKQIMQQVKGMTMQEVIELVKQFTGNKQPSGNPNPQSAEYNPNWA